MSTGVRAIGAPSRYATTSAIGTSPGASATPRNVAGAPRADQW